MTVAENRMTSARSPDGRRILVALVTGEAGRRIQAWREQNDPGQAERLPPHATLCYWAPSIEVERLEQQVRHAFGRPVTVRLGGVSQADNDQETLYVQVLDTGPLDEVRARLYDGTYVALPRPNGWLWHVTCVRDSRHRDKGALIEAARELHLNQAWTVDTVAYLELRGQRYEPITTWKVDA